MNPQSLFQTIGPYRLLENFMGQDMVSRLLSHAAANQSHFSPARVDQDPTVDPYRRISQVSYDFGAMRQDLETRFRSVFAWALRELGMPTFDIAHMELELVAHGDGAFCKRHIDTGINQPNATTDRTLTAVYYFHRLPKAFQGGELRLHSIALPDHGGQYLDLVPPSDSLLLFPSWMPHEVCPVFCSSKNFLDSRFAINCWYQKQRA